MPGSRILLLPGFDCSQFLTFIQLTPQKHNWRTIFVIRYITAYYKNTIQIIYGIDKRLAPKIVEKRYFFRILFAFFI